MGTFVGEGRGRGVRREERKFAEEKIGWELSWYRGGGILILEYKY